MNYSNPKSGPLLDWLDLIRALSESREASLFPGITLKGILNANYNLQNLAPSEVVVILIIKAIAEAVKRNNISILETDDDERGSCS